MKGLPILSESGVGSEFLDTDKNDVNPIIGYKISECFWQNGTVKVCKSENEK